MKYKLQFDELSRVEKLNFLTHAISFLLVLLSGPILMPRAFQFTDSWLVRGSIFGFLLSSLVMFGTSASYHFSIDADVKRKWRLADHIGIYVMIAGSYSPFMAIYFWEPKGKIVFISMWIMAIVGAIFKWYAAGRFNMLSTFLYVLMGLTIVLVSDSFFPLLPSEVTFYIFLGGGFYLIGVIFYLLKYWYYHHPVWHLFVIAGAFSHWWAVWLALS